MKTGITPTVAHYVMWAERNKPNWAKGLKLPVIANVDSIINNRAGIKTDRFIANSLALLYLVRSNIKSGAEKKTLIEYCNSLNDPQNPKRQAYFRRIGRKLAKIQLIKETIQ